jgi:hypothetical protein
VSRSALRAGALPATVQKHYRLAAAALMVGILRPSPMSANLPTCITLQSMSVPSWSEAPMLARCRLMVLSPDLIERLLKALLSHHSAAVKPADLGTPVRFCNRM